MFKKFAFLFLLISSNCIAQTYMGTVVAIKDGDTVVVLDSLHNQTTLRLAEVDCPEKSQAFGMKAKQFTSDEIYLKEVKYMVTDIDQYGRSVAKVYYDKNKYLSEEIIKNGYGWQYKKYSSSKLLTQLEEEARKNKIGLWVDPNPVYPSDFRRK